MVTWLSDSLGPEHEAHRPRAQQKVEPSPVDLKAALLVEGSTSLRTGIEREVLLEPSAAPKFDSQLDSQRSQADPTAERRIVQIQTTDGTPLPNLPINCSGHWLNSDANTDESGQISLSSRWKSIFVELPPEPGATYLIDELPIEDGIRRLVLDQVGVVRLRWLDLDGVELECQTEANLRPQLEPATVGSVLFEPGRLVYLSRAAGPLELSVVRHEDASVESWLVSIDPALFTQSTWESIGVPGAVDHPADITMASGIRHFSFTGRLLNGIDGYGPFTRRTAPPKPKSVQLQVEVTLATGKGAVIGKYGVFCDGEFDVSFFVKAGQVQDLSFALSIDKGEDTVRFTYRAATGGGLGAGRHELGDLVPSLESHSNALETIESN